MLEIFVIAAIAFILTLIIVISRKSKALIAIVKDIKPWDEYLYQAYVELEKGKIREILVFSKYPLKKNSKVVLERKGENLFAVKKFID